MNINYPDWLYQTTWIYHITAIDNLESIIKSGYIFCTNSNQISSNHYSIANKEIQDKRAATLVNILPNGCLHDYVPFYFAPRSPMLFVNHHGGINNATHQNNIVHLVTHAQLINQSQLPFVFYDRHAIIPYARVWNDLAELNHIDWELFFEPPLIGEYSRFWDSKDEDSNPKWIKRKEVRQAEFLIYDKLPWQLIMQIGTINKVKATEIKAILRKSGVDTPVVIRPEWYY